MTAGFRPEFFARLADLEARHFWFRARNALITRALRQHFPGARSLLELGCGNGFVLRGIRTARPDLHLVGTELFSEGLAFARGRVPEAAFARVDARALPFKDASLDVVGAFDVVEHIEEDEQVLREAYRVTKPGGGIVLTVPQHRWLWSAVDDYSLHQRRYSRRELIERVEAAGFVRPWATSFVTLLLPLLLLGRRRRGPLTDAEAARELEVGDLGNRIGDWLMNVERWLIERGLSLPLGGSLLLVATRPTSAGTRGCCQS